MAGTKARAWQPATGTEQVGVKLRKGSAMAGGPKFTEDRVGVMVGRYNRFARSEDRSGIVMAKDRIENRMRLQAMTDGEFLRYMRRTGAMAPTEGYPRSRLAKPLWVPELWPQAKTEEAQDDSTAGA